MDRELLKVRALVGCLMPSVEVEIKNIISGKPRLAGPAGVLIEGDYIPAEWEVESIRTPASGRFGTVRIYIKT